CSVESRRSSCPAAGAGLAPRAVVAAPRPSGAAAPALPVRPYPVRPAGAWRADAFSCFSAFGRRRRREQLVQLLFAAGQVSPFVQALAQHGFDAGQTVNGGIEQRIATRLIGADADQILILAVMRHQLLTQLGFFQPVFI